MTTFKYCSKKHSLQEAYLHFSGKSTLSSYNNIHFWFWRHTQSEYSSLFTCLGFFSRFSPGISLKDTQSHNVATTHPDRGIKTFLGFILCWGVSQRSLIAQYNGGPVPSKCLTCRDANGLWFHIANISWALHCILQGGYYNIVRYHK